MLRDKLKSGYVLAPGIYDALTGLIAMQSGAEAVYLSGASIAYTRFGRSDIGLVSVSEVHDTLAAITDRIDIPVIVDADTGFGNALNVQRTVRQFERAGASAIQLEDQSFPKRCGHLDGKMLVPQAEMVGKIKAALDARVNDDTLIIARTDARAVDGLDAALEAADDQVAKTHILNRKSRDLAAATAAKAASDANLKSNQERVIPSIRRRNVVASNKSNQPRKRRARSKDRPKKRRRRRRQSQDVNRELSPSERKARRQFALQALYNCRNPMQPDEVVSV